MYNLYNYEQEWWYFDFFQFLDMSLPPGGQIQKSIWLKCCSLIDFMICHKFAINCACKLWTGMMIFRFFFQILDTSMPPCDQIQKSMLLKCSTWYISWFATRLQFIVYVIYEKEQSYYDFFQFVDMSLPPGCQIQKSIWLKCCTLIDFMICHEFAIHCGCKLWTGTMIFRFFQFLDILMPPGGQIHKAILLKCSTLIHFMICYKIANHCVCKLWTGMMILRFFPKSPIFH